MFAKSYSYLTVLTDLSISNSLETYCSPIILVSYLEQSSSLSSTQFSFRVQSINQVFVYCRKISLLTQTQEGLSDIIYAWLLMDDLSDKKSSDLAELQGPLFRLGMFEHPRPP